MRSVFLWLGVFLLGAAQAQAQRPGPHNVQIGIGASGILYSGDLTPRGEGIQRVFMGSNFSVQFDSPKRITPQFNLGFGKFVSQNPGLGPTEGVQPNTFVSTKFFSLDLLLRARFRLQEAFRPHIGLGPGLLSFTPRDATGKDLTNATTTRAKGETYSNSSFYFSAVIGATYRLNDFVTAGAELKRYLTTTDYLDNVGQLGTRKGNDHLTSLQLSLLFTLGTQPGFRR